jgi:hypothetical protein
VSFERRGETVIGAHSLDELKLVYRVLHRHLSQHVDLMDTHFLIELQNFLHAMARADGVDASDHTAWDVWLGNIDSPSCDMRVRRRRTIDPNSQSPLG